MDIQNTNKKYYTTNTLVYSCQYHVIWTTKYRRPVLTAPIQERLKQLVLEKQDYLVFKVIEIEVMEDHVHLLIDSSPYVGIYRTVNQLKGYTSRILRKEFKDLKSRLPSLWTRSKFVSTVGSVSLETVKKYIEGQKNK